MRFKFKVDAVIPGLVKMLESAQSSSAIMDVSLPIIEKHWRNLAQTKLSPRQAAVYMRAMSLVRVKGRNAIMSLDRTAPQGEYALMIETGNSSFDMRDTMLAPFGLEYRRIAIAHTPPGSPSAKGTPVGKPYYKKLGKDESDNLARRMYNENFRGKYKLGMNQPLDEGSSGFPVREEYHKTDIYTGLRRNKRTPKSRERLITYRTISHKSPSAAWQYPQREGHFLMEQALEASVNEVGEAIGNLFSAVVRKVRVGIYSGP